jgi:ribonuclease-3
MDDWLEELQDLLQYRFGDPALLRLAMTHASARGRDGPSNERLEFLGDAVMGLVVSAHLFGEKPRLSEGEMTSVKSTVVSRRVLSHVSRALGLPTFLQVDSGLQRRTRYPGSVVANAYEAVVGAIFADGGLGPAREFVMRTLGPEVKKVQDRRHVPNYKAVLQERTQAEGKGTPEYAVVRWEGPDHRRSYRVVVQVAGEQCGTGAGETKKEAEQQAAGEALDRLYPDWEEEPA